MILSPPSHLKPSSLQLANTIMRMHQMFSTKFVQDEVVTTANEVEEMYKSFVLGNSNDATSSDEGQE